MDKITKQLIETVNSIVGSAPPHIAGTDQEISRLLGLPNGGGEMVNHFKRFMDTNKAAFYDPRSKTFNTKAAADAFKQRTTVDPSRRPERPLYDTVNSYVPPLGLPPIPPRP